jgi:hypothetical protein
VLQQAHPSVIFSEEAHLDSTLKELGLVPRAALIAIPSHNNSGVDGDDAAGQRKRQEAMAAAQQKQVKLV